MLDIIHGLEYLHGQNIAHLDLKSPNILIDKDGMAKIADVGLSKLVGTIEATATSSGSLLWAAPEQINMKVRCTFVCMPGVPPASDEKCSGDCRGMDTC